MRWLVLLFMVTCCSGKDAAVRCLELWDIGSTEKRESASTHFIRACCDGASTDAKTDCFKEAILMRDGVAE